MNKGVQLTCEQVSEGRSSVDKVHELPWLYCSSCWMELRIQVEEVKKKSFVEVVCGFAKENDWVRKIGPRWNTSRRNF